VCRVASRFHRVVVVSLAHKVADPDGFECTDCGLRFPWVASTNEGTGYRLCRSCVRVRPATRRSRVKFLDAHPRAVCQDCGVTVPYVRGQASWPQCVECFRVRSMRAQANGVAVSAARRNV
jgi:hypothetical protein